MILIEAVLMGVFATFFMDAAASILAGRNLLYPFISQEAIGRWFLYNFKGKLIHRDIHQTPALNNEKRWCQISHYLIGVALAGVFLVLDAKLAYVRDHWWMSLLFGIATVFFPWFWLLPSTGFGVMASRSPHRAKILRTNLINHTNFGLGLLLWMVLLHRFFV